MGQSLRSIAESVAYARGNNFTPEQTAQHLVSSFGMGNTAGQAIGQPQNFMQSLQQNMNSLSPQVGAQTSKNALRDIGM